MLKAQDGCNQVCAYCIVPSVRGGQRSRRCDDVVAEARERVRAGVRELVLCGIRLGAYGWDWPARRGSRFVPLQELVRALGEVAGLERLRLSSLLPLDIGPDLGRVLADTPVVCEHLHLPLQAGDDQVLRAMRRGYTTRRYREVVERLRAALPGVALATDVMVGFPGETAEQFARTLAFCRELAFADLHVFAYSPRPGTAAAALPDDVPPAEKHARSQALLALRAALRQEFAARWLGQSVTILVEECVHGAYEGLTRDYLRVRVAGVAPLGSLQPVTVTAIGPEVLVGQAAR
jgi:threonylcarbamoyladenosine tRNA methylthiotransferase MtaB